MDATKNVARGNLLTTDSVLAVKGPGPGYGHVQVAPNKHNAKRCKRALLPQIFKNFMKKWNRNQRRTKRLLLSDSNVKAWEILKGGVVINGKPLRAGERSGVMWSDAGGEFHMASVGGFVYLREHEFKCHLFVEVQERKILGTVGAMTTVTSAAASTAPKKYIDVQCLSHVIWFTKHYSGEADKSTSFRLWETAFVK